MVRNNIKIVEDDNYVFYGDESTSSLIMDSFLLQKRRRKIKIILKVMSWSFLLLTFLSLLVFGIKTKIMEKETLKREMLLSKSQIEQETSLRNCTEHLRVMSDLAPEIRRLNSVIDSTYISIETCRLRAEDINLQLKECQLELQKYYLLSDNSDYPLTPPSVPYQGSSERHFIMPTNYQQEKISGLCPYSSLVYFKMLSFNLKYNPIINKFSNIIVIPHENSVLFWEKTPVTITGNQLLNHVSERSVGFESRTILKGLHRLETTVKDNEGLSITAKEMIGDVSRTLPNSLEYNSILQTDCSVAGDQKRIFQLCIKGADPTRPSCIENQGKMIYILESNIEKDKITLDRIRPIMAKDIKKIPKGESLDNNLCFKMTYQNGLCLNRRDSEKGGNKYTCVYPIFYLRQSELSEADEKRDYPCSYYPDSIVMHEKGSKTEIKKYKHLSWMLGVFIVRGSDDSIKITFSPISYQGAIIIGMKINKLFFIIDLILDSLLINPLRAYVDLKEVSPSRANVVKMDMVTISAIFNEYKTHCFPVEILPTLIDIPCSDNFQMLIKRKEIRPIYTCFAKQTDRSMLSVCEKKENGPLWVSDFIEVSIIKEETGRIINLSFCDLSGCENTGKNQRNKVYIPQNSVSSQKMICGQATKQLNIKVICTLILSSIDENLGIYTNHIHNLYLG
ncbi:putative attachment protein [Sunshine Coast virus]|uniref:Putative attachment protein n=1 Tax=Sunshine Coast virus TaxID=1195087 RepID=I3VIZ2_9MONO|nr:putative attachment protein [Sunshine Coast virus]AFK79809.1 putative attachment protein [Sunshine Coast virus]